MLDAVALLPRGASPIFWAAMIGTFGFWLVAYVLIIERSFRERTFGMPITALCCNLAWELLLSTVFASEYLLTHLGNILWLLFDVGILIAILRFAPREFHATPLLSRRMRPLVWTGTAMAVAVQGVFMWEFDDTKGFVSGWAIALLMAILFVAMFLRRGNTKGQSFGIALSMLLGNASALVWVVTEPGAPPVRTTAYVLLVLTLSVNSLYAAIMFQARKRDRARRGVRPSPGPGRPAPGGQTASR